MNGLNGYVINTQGLSKASKGVLALKPLDLQVRQNSICGFLGPNGAGNSTTIKLLLGLSRPTNGSAQVFGMAELLPELTLARRPELTACENS